MHSGFCIRSAGRYRGKVACGLLSSWLRRQLAASRNEPRDDDEADERTQMVEAPGRAGGASDDFSGIDFRCHLSSPCQGSMIIDLLDQPRRALR